MLGLLVKIPFFGQINRSEPRLASRIKGAIEAAGRASAASIRLSEEPAFLYFDDLTNPCKLRAAEASRILSESFTALEARLHGWNLILDTCMPDAEENQRYFRKLWLALHSDGFFLGPGAVETFESYFETADRGRDAHTGSCIPVLMALHAKPRSEREALHVLRGGPFFERIIEELGSLGAENANFRSLLILGPERSATNQLHVGLEYLYGAAAREFISFRPSIVSASPYDTILGGLLPFTAAPQAKIDADRLLSEAERGLYEELTALLDFLSRSPYRLAYSPAFDLRLRVCAAAALRLYARERRAASMPAFVILEEAERFSAPSLALSQIILDEVLAAEGLKLIATGTRPPEGWPLQLSSRLELSSVTEFEKLEAEPATRTGGMRAKNSSEKNSGREAAASRESARSELASLPREYAEMLLALRLGEEALGNEDMDEFLDSQGYVAGIRSFVYERLEQLGFIEGPGRPRIASEYAAEAADSVLGDSSRRIKAAFSSRLHALHAGHRLIPSLALYRRIAELDPDCASPSSDAFFLDCAAADALYGPSEPGNAAIESPLETYPAFLEAYEGGDREASEHALRDLEKAAATGGRLVADIAAVARAAVEYALHAPAQAARVVKGALIDLHTLGVQESESRAHRILGLCALAQGQIQEGADYLGNAFEIAQGVGNPLCAILAAQAEAAAYLVLGDIGRSRARTELFATLSRTAFRPDWEMAGNFMKGRIALELGDFEAAEEAFGRVRSEAEVYAEPMAKLRAEVWIGRTAVCSGDEERAVSILTRYREDREALWFLAEQELWSGRPAQAAALLDSALAAASEAAFASADAFDWSSGFASIEGRSVGFATDRSYAEDQIAALRDYAAALASPMEAVERAEHLATQAREERLSSIHPSLHHYLFYRYRILREIGSGSMDAATVLSKAFKALQTRSARMSDSVQKDAFMERNRWNREILAEARRCKLI